MLIDPLMVLDSMTHDQLTPMNHALMTRTQLQTRPILPSTPPRTPTRRKPRQVPRRRRNPPRAARRDD